MIIFLALSIPVGVSALIAWLVLWLNSPRTILRYIESPNLIMVAENKFCRHDPTVNNDSGCLGKFRLECTYCGWHDGWHYSYYYGRDAHVEHTCPTVDELAKATVWEKI